MQILFRLDPIDIIKCCFLYWAAVTVVTFNCCLFVVLSALILVGNWKVSSAGSMSGDWLMSDVIKYLYCKALPCYSIDFRIHSAYYTSISCPITNKLQWVSYASSHACSCYNTTPTMSDNVMWNVLNHQPSLSFSTIDEFILVLSLVAWVVKTVGRWLKEREIRGSNPHHGT